MRGSVSQRRASAVESFRTVAEDVGRLDFGSSVFAITRGQWSMIDAILHTLDCCEGPCSVSVWTWTVAEYEIQTLSRLRRDERVSDGRLIIDIGSREKNAELIREWRLSFGQSTVRFVRNHAKIALIEDAAGRKFALRGSMNLNFNPRFEQFDLTEGGPEFELIRSIEDELPSDVATVAEARRATKIDSAFDENTLSLFGDGLKTWRPK